MKQIIIKVKEKKAQNEKQIEKLLEQLPSIRRLEENFGKLVDIINLNN